MYPGTFAASTPDKPAVVMGSTGEVVTYRELDDRSLRLARLLHDRGLRRGDRVAILAENHARYPEVYWAAIRSGLYITAVNRYLAAAEASYIVDDAGATALVTTAALADTATAMLPDLGGCPTRLMLDGVRDGFEPYEDALAATPAEPLADQRRGDMLLYSSGTTGRPKGVRRPLRDVAIDDPAAGGASMLGRFLLGMDESSVYLNPAPLYHAAALAWSTGVHELGGTLVVMDRFDAEGFLSLVEAHGITHSQVVPTMFVRMLKLPEEVRARYDLGSLQAIVHAAAPCPPEVKRAMIDWLGPIVFEYFSATEGNGITFITPQEWLEHPGSVGKPISGVPHICDDEGVELPTGEAGLVYFEQPETTFEYHGDAEKTKQSRHPHHDNWTALGDIGYLDDEGYLYLTDRKAFMIISGGVNVYPAEIESCLVMHPAVADVAVFGLPDAEMGERVHAVVQPAADVAASPALAEELRAYAREHLAGYKVPKAVDFRDELPRLPTGKLAKGPLRDEYVQQQGA